ncbi:hypothetical protein D7V86_11795 [bacterium D16-51]|nr:hypothetical protein D7V96_13650 [bacterium D16-59]RKI59696.1 hypothetical protein D7V86_11795 [bacterium D16-51]
MDFPKDFTDRIYQMLGKEADSFFESQKQPPAYGLRINPLKFSGHISAKILPFTLAPVAWAREGYYAEPIERPGKHPLHEGGAYYIQEPSAMSVASLAAPEPGELICDLCAAPGGKSTQIAGRLMGKGLLVSNEISPSRAKILSQNIERFGAVNCIVCNEPPDKMARQFPLFFHKIIVDAPCSGEGMFRKDENAKKEWSLQQVGTCRKRQQMILECADQMLSPGGVIIYSTCTFSPEEDEQIISWFLSAHPDYILEDWKDFLPVNCGLECGMPQFADTKSSEITKTLRLWPHKLKGEGHFAARLKKAGTILPPDLQTSQGRQRKKGKKTGQNTSYQKNRQPEISGYLEFIKQNIMPPNTEERYSAAKLLNGSGTFQYFGEELYLIPEGTPSLDGLKIMRAGLHLGTRKKNRFEPSHALAMALSPENCVQHTDCSYETAVRYLHGEVIPCDPAFHSWVLVCCQGVSLGWGKAQNGILKNHYPKGLRSKIVFEKNIDYRAKFL